ncbi:MAG TPA: hypothetical protein VFG04_16290 [Planctomycetaceae bacterium]|nr:hypothetical protein [Planctomycetaceae bacterium]
MAIRHDALEVAPDRVEFVIAGHRRVNLRTRPTKIFRRAGLEPWPKLFHNLCATRQTEMEESFPTHVVCAWLGNSPKVAGERYLQVTPEHFAKAVRNPVHYAGTRNDTEPHTTSAARENRRDIRGDAVVCGSVQCQKVEDRGLEPLGDFDAKRNSASTSIDYQVGAAARALHLGGPNCHCSTLICNA